MQIQRPSVLNNLARGSRAVGHLELVLTFDWVLVDPAMLVISRGGLSRQQAGSGSVHPVQDPDQCVAGVVHASEGRAGRVGPIHALRVPNRVVGLSNHHQHDANAVLSGRTLGPTSLYWQTTIADFAPVRKEGKLHASTPTIRKSLTVVWALWRC